MRRKLHESRLFSAVAICALAVLTWALFFFGDRNHSSTAVCNDRLQTRGFIGNSDLYGLGIRLGVYLQWITFLVAEAALPEETSDIAGAYAAFSVALLVAMLILIFEDGCVFTIEICVLLTILFGGFWCVLGRKKPAGKTRKQDADAEVLGLEIIPIIICVLALVVGTWFWMRMAVLGEVDFAPTPNGTSFFLFARVTEQHLQPGSAFMAFFCIWIASTPVFELISHWSSKQPRIWKYLRPLLLLDLARASQNMERLCRTVLQYTQFPEPVVSKITQLFLSMLYFCISIWFILAVEFELKWNEVEGVNEIKTTGQIIPFVIGIFSILQIGWKLLKKLRKQSKEDQQAQGTVLSECSS